MKVLIVLALALVAIVVAVQGEKMTIKVRSMDDQGLISKYVDVEINSEDQVLAVANKSCEILKGRVYENSFLTDLYYSAGGEIHSYQKVSNAKRIKNGKKFGVTCRA